MKGSGRSDDNVSWKTTAMCVGGVVKQAACIRRLLQQFYGDV
jgi:hypothetical protein